MAEAVNDIFGIGQPSDLPQIVIPDPEPVPTDPLVDNVNIEADLRKQRIQDAQRRGRASLLRSEDPAINTSVGTGLSIK